MKTTRAVALSAVLFASTLLSGCIGIYDNTDIFFDLPNPDMPEAELLQKYGTPSYAGFADDQKIYTYKVRDNKYIILIGLYEGYDLVITCRDGVVVKTDRVERPTGFALFNPVPWAEGLE